MPYPQHPTPGQVAAPDQPLSHPGPRPKQAWHTPHLTRLPVTQTEGGGATADFEDSQLYYPTS